MQIDTAGMMPGDSIAQARCEQWIGFSESSDPNGWKLCLLQLLGIVQKQLKQQHGRELTVRIIGCELHVLTDQEAAAYNPRRFDAGLRQARRAHRRLMSVNVGNLSADERSDYAKVVNNQAHKLSMLRQKEVLPLPPAERVTPVMSWQVKKPQE